MKVIYVIGEGDFDALMFEDSGIDFKKTYNKAMLEGGSTFFEIEGVEIEVYAKEFKNVDPEFIGFMYRHFIDYDMSKCSNFFIVKE